MMSGSDEHDILLRVAKGEKADRAPVWLMRQVRCGVVGCFAVVDGALESHVCVYMYVLLRAHPAVTHVLRCGTRSP